MTARQLKEIGVTYYRIRQLLSDEIIYRVKRGVYALTDFYDHDEGVIRNVLPTGIYCMATAAFYQQLTTRIPLAHHMAVPRKSKHTLPDYPPIELYYWNETAYRTGITRLEVNGAWVSSYDREKTVCDYFRFRNKLEISQVREILRTYLAFHDRDLDKLARYARLLRIHKILRPYLDYLV